MSEKPISPLRQRMIEDMTVGNFAEKTTQRLYPTAQDLHSLPQPFAGYSDSGGSSPLPRLCLSALGPGAAGPTTAPPRLSLAWFSDRARFGRLVRGVNRVLADAPTLSQPKG